MEIARAAAQAFGVRVVELQPLGSSDNTTFRVIGHAKDFVLRLHNQGGRSLEEIRSELELLTWLNARGVRVQQPVILQPLEFESRRWSLLTWLRGEVFQSFSPELAFQAGASLARLHSELAVFKLSISFTRPQHDLEFYQTLSNELGKIAWMPSDDHGRIEGLVARAKTAFATLQGRDWQLIHNDPQPLNWVWQDGVPTPIDFDLCGYGYIHADLCSAMLFLEHEDAVLQGYESARPLPSNFTTHRQTFMGLAFLENLAFLAHNPVEREFIEAEMLPYLRQKLITIKLCALVEKWW